MESGSLYVFIQIIQTYNIFYKQVSAKQSSGHVYILLYIKLQLWVTPMIINILKKV